MMDGINRMQECNEHAKKNLNYFKDVHNQERMQRKMFDMQDNGIGANLNALGLSRCLHL